MEPTAAFHPRPTTSYKDDIIFANIITYRSSTSKNLLEPKSHLPLATTFEILALYRNIVKHREINCGSPFKTNNQL
jgi:hypothetical protein